jgi:endonuclease G
MKPITALLLAALAVPAEQRPFGSPDCSGPDREAADRGYFFVCHSRSGKVPLWVGYTLTAAQLTGSAPRPSRFREDRGLSGPRATDRDYRGSGYSRGHLAPAADFAFSDNAIRTTFLLSNAVPQKQGVNAGRWAQVEAAVRRVAGRADRVYVFTGVLLEGEARAIGPGQLAVPSHTFKAVLAVQGGQKKMYAVIVPNRERVREPLEEFAVEVDEVERRSGLDLFGELDDDEERKLESRRESLAAAADVGGGDGDEGRSGGYQVR